MIRQFIDVMDGRKQAYIYDKYPTLDMALYRRSGLGKHLVFTGQIYRESSIKKRSLHNNGLIYTLQAQNIKVRRCIVMPPLFEDLQSP